MHSVDKIVAKCKVTRADAIYLATTEAELEEALKCLEEAGEKEMAAEVVSNILYVGDW